MFRPLLRRRLLPFTGLIPVLPMIAACDVMALLLGGALGPRRGAGGAGGRHRRSAEGITGGLTDARAGDQAAPAPAAPAAGVESASDGSAARRRRRGPATGSGRRAGWVRQDDAIDAVVDGG